MQLALPKRRTTLATLATLAIVVVTVVVLRWEGRLWWCACGQLRVWADAYGKHNSQHLADPYTFTHMLHGVIFWWALVWAKDYLSVPWRVVIALAVEALWEIVENTQWAIDRYRTATAAVGYEGDTVVNVLGDIAATGIGLVLAQRIGWRWSLVLFIATELILLIWIRDSLLLTVVMLLFPLESLKQWQMGAA